MPYITVMQKPRYRQISLDEILAGEVDVSKFNMKFDETGTVTHYVERVSESLRIRTDVPGIIGALSRFCKKYESLYEQERSSLYHEFYIPKRSGGLRKIDAPNDELKGALRELCDILRFKCGLLYHTSAQAYVRGRSVVHAIEKHQANGSKWFFKSDFSDFFGSTTEEFAFSALSQLFPLSEVVASEDGRKALRKALNLCFLRGGLPQGTPASPFLTNLVMIPFDYRMSNLLWQDRFVYTRYADDIQISHQYGFSATEMCDRIRAVLKDVGAPYQLKNEKTRYGSSSGSNWNLGLMLNRDNNITVGWRAKKTFEAMLTNYILDHAHRVAWTPHDINHVLGLYAHYKSVEPDAINRIVGHLNHKYNTNVIATMRNDLK